MHEHLTAHLCCAGRCEAEGEAVAEGDDSQAIAEQHDKCAKGLVQGAHCGGILLQAGHIVSDWFVAYSRAQCNGASLAQTRLEPLTCP